MAWQQRACLAPLRTSNVYLITIALSLNAVASVETSPSFPNLRCTVHGARCLERCVVCELQVVIPEDCTKLSVGGHGEKFGDGSAIIFAEGVRDSLALHSNTLE